MGASEGVGVGVFVSIVQRSVTLSAKLGGAVLASARAQEVDSEGGVGVGSGGDGRLGGNVLFQVGSKLDSEWR